MTVQLLLTILRDKKSIQIKGIQKDVVGLARYSTINNMKSEYIKVAFTDGSGMYFPIDEEVAFYFEKKLGTAFEVSDIDINGVNKDLKWNGIDFRLVNGNDYQYVKELYVGDIHGIEGEVRFSDYESDDGGGLSLGWNMYEHKRDDVYAVPLDLSELE